MSRILAVSAVVVFVLAGVGYATRDDASSAGEPKSICEEALRSIAKGDLQEGFAVFRKHQLRPPTDEEWESVVRGVAQQVQLASAKLGKPLGYEWVRESKVNGSLRKYIYLVKYERDVQRWVFVFYRPDKAWRLFRVDWDQNVDAILN